MSIVIKTWNKLSNIPLKAAPSQRKQRDCSSEVFKFSTYLNKEGIHLYYGPVRCLVISLKFSLKSLGKLIQKPLGRVCVCCVY